MDTALLAVGLIVGVGFLVWLLVPLQDSLRGTVGDSFVILGAAVVALTEVLSLFTALASTTLLITWSLLLVAGILAITLHPRLRDSAVDRVTEVRRHVGELAPWLDGQTRRAVALSFVAITFGLTLVVAVNSPPNNWDSMSYHLPRVMHWAANASVSHYPTGYDAQLYNGPFAEIALLHVYLLSGSDHLFNLVQWTASVITVLMASKVASDLGAGRDVQLLASLLAATVPLAVLESTSTQNDLVLAALLLILVRHLLSPGPITSRQILMAGLCAGLVLLTKSTGYLLIGPFLALFAWKHRRERTRLLAGGVGVAAIATVLNCGAYVRNLDRYGTPFGPRQAFELHSNGRFGWDVTVTNLFRATGSAAAGPWESLNLIIGRLVDGTTRLVGSSPSDPATILGAHSYRVSWSNNEDLASAPVHVLLVLVTLGLLWRRPRGPVFAFAMALLAAFVLFTSYLKWQPWLNRLDLPLLLLWCPAIAVALHRLGRAAETVGAAAVVLVAAPFLVLNATRPLVGPGSVLSQPETAVLFNARPELRTPYQQLADVITSRGARRVGIVSGPDAWEYPLWRLTRDAAHPRRFDQVALGSAQHYDLVVCLQVPVAQCEQAVEPGWALTQLSGNLSVITPNDTSNPVT